MIDYRPLRDFMYFNEIKISDLVDAGFNSRTMAKIKKNEYVSLETLEKLCLHLKIPIEQVVEILPDKE